MHESIMNRKEINRNKKETIQLMKKYSIQTDRPSKTSSKSTSNINYMNKSKLLKYSTLNKNYYKNKAFDSNNKPIITKDDLERGLINMIYKGLIPKTADLTPAFNREGHPMQLNMKNVKEIYAKNKVKDEIETENYLEKIKYNLEDYSNADKKEKNIESNLFITVAPVNNKVKSKIPTDLTSPNKTEAAFKKTITDKEKEDEIIKEYLQTKHKTYLLFSNYKIVRNEEYHNFKFNNDERWGAINYLIEHLQKIFKKINIPICEVEAEKLERLANDEHKIISNKDLINCLSDKDMAIKGINPNDYKQIYNNLKEAFITRIQQQFRVFLAKTRVKDKRIFLTKVHKIQRVYRLYKLIQESRELVKENFIKNYVKFRELTAEFKRNWKTIKNSPRIEIHINSLSYSSYKNTTIEKFSEKENNQLGGRIISLLDPNVDIVYISPYILSNEILSYYFSILQTLGVTNGKERFHLIVPDSCEKIPPNFSLTQLLLYSASSLQKLRSFLNSHRDKFSYIIPGVISKHDLTLAMYLECPILFDDLEMTQTLFSKSGSKRVFELTDMALPISAWDIKSEEEFYSSLTQLVKNYLTINIWIFKIDSEHNGRGIAYIVLDKIKSFVDLKRERLNNLNYDEEKFESQLKFILKKTIPKKVEIVSNKLFRGWDEFFTEFCYKRGVIESCPTGSLSGIMGNPAVGFLIHPDGKCETLCTYDKINTNYFRNCGAIAPQQSIPNLNSDLIIDKLGKYLYEQNIFGYVTVEFVTFHDGQKVKIHYQI